MVRNAESGRETEALFAFEDAIDGADFDGHEPAFAAVYDAILAGTIVTEDACKADSWQPHPDT